MALINCSECGKEISDQAAACPFCGCPLTVISDTLVDDSASVENLNEKAEKPAKKTTKYFLIAAIAIVVVGLAFSFGHMSGETSDSDKSDLSASSEEQPEEESDTAADTQSSSITSSDDFIVGDWHSYATSGEDGINVHPGCHFSAQKDSQFTFAVDDDNTFRGTWTRKSDLDMDDSSYVYMLDISGKGSLFCIVDEEMLSIGMGDFILVFERDN